MTAAGKRIIGALRQVIDFVSGARVAPPMVIWIPDANNVMHPHAVHSIDEMYRLQTEERETPMTDATVNGKMDVLDPTGHTELTWNSGNTEEVETARIMFNQMTGRGYQAFRPGPSKGERGTRITSFDPSIERMILFPQLQGG